MKGVRRVVEEQYKKRRSTGIEKKMSIGELRILMAKELDLAWKELCKADIMRASFADVGLSLNIDGSEDHRMKFQGQSPRKPAGIIF